jgi:hypothetical protein
MLFDSKAKYPRPAEVWLEKLKQGLNLKSGATPAEDAQVISTSAEDVSPLATLEWMCVSELKHLWRRFKTARGQLGDHTLISDDLGKPLPWALVERIYANAAKSYFLECLDSRGILFRADPNGDRPARVLDGSLGWCNLFRSGLEIIQVTGDHLTMMQQPHNLRLASEISKVLNRFRVH